MHQIGLFKNRFLNAVCRPRSVVLLVFYEFNELMATVSSHFVAVFMAHV